MEKNAKQQLRSKQQLAIDISQLLQNLENLNIANQDLKLRHKALFRNIRAMDVRARMLNGEKFSFAEEARLCYDVQIPQYDFTKFDHALSEINKLVPGEGDLALRAEL